MKAIISLLYFVIILSASSCQTKNEIQNLLYSIEKNVNPETEHLRDFNHTHSLSIWATHHYEQKINDTSYILSLSQNRDSLYVINMNKFSTRTIALDALKGKEGGGIWAFYYHNHDSIFFFIDRYYVLYCEKKKAQKYNDIILLDGKGNRVNEYSLDSMPDIYDGTLYGKHYPWDQYITERMFAGGILVDAIFKKPYMNTDAFASLNPKIIGLYDLKNRKIRMLNIKYPPELIRKNYDIQPSLRIIKYNDNELLIGFGNLPYIYRYNLSEDTMKLIPANYDLHFMNVDSASMKKGKDYVSVCYKEPIWCPEHSFYCRNMIIKYCKGYIPGRKMMEILDSNFNHIGYVAGNKEFSVECSQDGILYAYEKSSDDQYHIILENRKKHIDRTRFLHTFLEKTPPARKRPISTERYLNMMQIPDSSLIVIINLKYPCGECLEELLNFYKKHQSTMENRRMYYIFYDPDKSGLTKELMKRYGVKNARNILEDNKLLSNVSSVIPDQEYQNAHYLYLERHFQDGKTLLAEPTIEQLMPMLDKTIKKITNQ